MSIRISIISILLVSIGFSQELPKSIRVHFSNYTEMIAFSEIPLDSAFYFPDVQRVETTNCTYLLDFQTNECSVYYADSIVGKAPIVSVQQITPSYKTEFDTWEYIIKLEDAANDTEIRISIESNSFLYTYEFLDLYERVITFSMAPVITVSD